MRLSVQSNSITVLKADTDDFFPSPHYSTVLYIIYDQITLPLWASNTSFAVKTVSLNDKIINPELQGTYNKREPK